MDITAIHQIFLTCTSVTTDSRNCPQGSLFIALKGESFNGNAFAARALESGSAYAIVKPMPPKVIHDTSWWKTA